MDKETFDTYITLSILIPILIMASIGQVLILTEPSEDIKMINETEHANTNIPTSPVAIETSNNDEKITLVHELGHSFGLLPSKNPAIDSRAVSYNDYPSIMNYNYRYSGSDELVYADNGYYDDWQMIEEQLNETEYLFG